MLALSIPNEYLQYGSFFFGLTALIPHFIALNKCPSVKKAFCLCFIQSITAHIFSSYWLTFSKEFALFTLGASAIGTAFMHSLFAPLFLLPQTAQKIAVKRNSSLLSILQLNDFKAFWFAAVYTLWEYFKSTGFLAYPWGTLPMCAFNQKLITQIVDITGVRGISFLISYTAAGLAFLIMDYTKFTTNQIIGRNKRTITAILALYTVSTVYGFIQYTKPRTPEKYMNAILIQQNYDPWKQPDDSQSIYDSQNLTLLGVQQLSEQNKKPDLVVWSEGVLHYPIPVGSDTHYKYFPEERPLVPFLKEIGAPTIIGAPYCYSLEELRMSNAAILFNTEGLYQDYYAKIHLVPFAERIPFFENEIIRTVVKKVAGIIASWIPGTEYKTFTIPLSENPGQNVEISTPLCFEDAFGDICSKLKLAGTEVFINLTDDSWSQKTSAEYQHFIIAWYRAMELRTTFVRSTNSGCTIVEDPSGRILYDLPLFEQTQLACSVPVYKNVLTFYAKHGEWLCHLLLIIVLSLVLLVLYQISIQKNTVFRKKL